MKKLGIALGICAFMVFGLLPIAINMIINEYSFVAAVALNIFVLVSTVIPIIIILCAVPATTAIVAISKRDRRLKNQDNHDIQSND